MDLKLKKKMDYKFLIEAITTEIAKEPSANLYKERGRLRMLQGDHQGAMEDLKKATELDPSLLQDIGGTFHN